MKPLTRRCAIYTRKSSEEGLELEFNSLDAQFEACQAYILSQKAEGWVQFKSRYDDGGFSGGNLERPGLKQLLADIQAGKVDIVVVYKIDRLTRSLMDFAKLVEIFDKHGVTFVSVTQSFNTTTSMGRLTLNVLLSFAQFEREVTGERIRDKVAASKKKGMWTGGCAPVGYNIVEKKLVPDPETTQLVQKIFQRYLDLGCVSALKRDLDRSSITSRVWVSSTGVQHGGASFSRGILYKILRNPIYIGQVSHKGKTHPGQHQGIIEQDIWDEVQARLVNGSSRGRGKEMRSAAELLRGKIFDPDGRPYSPTYTKKGSLLYRYYISQNLLQCRDHPDGYLARLPAKELEEAVLAALHSVFDCNTLAEIFDCPVHDPYVLHITENKSGFLDPEVALACLSKVTLAPKSLQLTVSTSELATIIGQKLKLSMPQPVAMQHTIVWPFTISKPNGRTLVLKPSTAPNHHDPFDRPEEEIRRWVQGIIWRDEHFRGLPIMQIAQAEKVSATKVLNLIKTSLEAI